MSGFTTTPNLGLYKPTVGGDDDAWGGHLNTNADTLDTQIATKSYTDGRRRRMLAQQTASIPNVGANTSEELGVVWAVPANTLLNVGDMIHLIVKMEFAGTTDSKNARVRFGASAGGISNSIAGVVTGAVVATTHSVLEVWIMKTAANAQKAWYWSIYASNNAQSGDSTLALTDTAVNYLSLTLHNSTAAAPASLTIFAAMVEFLPAV